jgi:hypothetical protein
MKILKKVLLYAFFSLAAIVALPFLFVELRNFFSFEFLNMNNPFLNGLAYFSRVIYFLLFLALPVFAILFMASKRKFCIILFAVAIVMFIGALLSLKLYQSFISLILIGVSFVELALISIGFFSKEKAESSASCPINE